MDAIAALRAFNRFYTSRVGALDARFLDTNLSLVEARLLYEVATRGTVLASTLVAELGIDPGFVSRIVRRLSTAGLIERGQGDDARRRPISLTTAGRAAFAVIDRRQYDRVAAHVAHLGKTEADRLTAALATVRGLLAPDAPVEVRAFGLGDMAAIVAAQADYYHRQHGWSRPMEALLLDVTGNFLRDHVPGRSQCWVAERAGTPVGSVFCFDAGGGTAQLRLMYVDSCVRGLGVGRRLAERCVAFAREAGYHDMMLWTHSILLPARALYSSLGFILESVEEHDEFGEPVQGEIWRLPLAH